jgi:methionyl-tRNA formyltransferase
MTGHPRIVFAGTPEFAVPTLDALVAAGHTVVAAYTQPDRPAGRGRQLTASPVKQRALALGIAVEQPDSLRSAAARARLAALDPDLLVVVAYGQLLGPKLLALPTLGCVNVHASLLPRWRGAAPIQRAILAGDAETGVTIMRMDEGLDTGPVYAERATAIGADETAWALHDRLAALGAALLVQTLPAIVTRAVTPVAQQIGGATYAHKLDKREARLDWSRSALELARAVRAFDPWPIAETQWGEVVLRIHRAQPLAEPTRAPPGTVLRTDRHGIDVATGAGVLRLLALQAPGGKVLEAGQFIAARELIGARLA